MSNVESRALAPVRLQCGREYGILPHMMYRTTILLEEEMVERLRSRANRRGSSLTAEIREAVAEYLAEDDPNAGLKALIGMGTSHGDYPPVDSDEAKEDLIRWIERDSFGLDPTGDDDAP